MQLPDTPQAALTKLLDFFSSQHTDLVFNALHGEFGEDGKLQALLDTLGIAYTGSGMLASGLGMDKNAIYKLLSDKGLPVPKTTGLTLEYTSEDLKAIQDSFNLPIFLKPNNGGSSIGVFKITDWAELDSSLKQVLAISEMVLVQEFIQGRELTCPVMDDMVLPVGEIRVDQSATFFDYQAKYTSDSTQEIFPAQVPARVISKVQDLALQVHRLISARGLTRSDFIYNEQTQDIVFLEINTCPGMTSSSLCPKSAAALGWSFEQLVQKILDSALQN